LRVNELIEYSRRIIADRMALDFFSRLFGSVVYRQKKDKISLPEIEYIQHALLANGIHSQLLVTPREYVLQVMAEYAQHKKENIRINIILFLGTLITTCLTGTKLAGRDPFENFHNFIFGLPYAFSLLIILGAHEFGHYWYARRHRIYATLPYFIPFFIPYFSFGTFGAFIKIKSPIPDKRALLDVGIAGPLAGFIMSLIFIIIGFWQLPDPEGVRVYISQINAGLENGGEIIVLGSSILFEFLRNLMGAQYLQMQDIYRFPCIFAGWIGLLVTALNLIPIGQLDGGHISYALFGKRAYYVAWFAFLAMVGLSFFFPNWYLWILLIFFVIRLKHPPTMNDQIPLDPGRRVLACCSYLIFISCFLPSPIYTS
jgi:membrane-associated protease RseP (regulator of RpoE activity)